MDKGVLSSCVDPRRRGVSTIEGRWVMLSTLNACDLFLRMVEGRWGMGASVVGRGRRALTVSVNLSFTLFTSRSLSTHVGCLLVTGFLKQTPPCVTTMFVYIPQTSPLHGGWPCWGVFCVIATNGSYCVCCVARVRAVCFPHMIRSTRRIVEDDLRRSR